MQSKCVVCHDKPSSFRCIQCHKPVCDDCSFKTKHGAFCGRECAAMYRDFKKSQRTSTPRRSGGLLKRLIVLIIIIAIALVVASKMGFISGIPGL